MPRRLAKASASPLNSRQCTSVGRQVDYRHCVCAFCFCVCIAKYIIRSNNSKNGETKNCACV